MEPWVPVGAAAWRDARCTSLTPEHFGVLLRLYGRAREAGVDTLQVPGLSAAELVAHVGNASVDAAAEALEVLSLRGLAHADGEAVVVTLGWPLPATRAGTVSPSYEETRAPAAPRIEDPKAIRRRASAAFAHAGKKSQADRLAWIDSPEGQDTLRRRGISLDVARSVAVTEPLQPGHDLRSRRAQPVTGAPVTTVTESGHGVTGGSGHESGHGPVTETERVEEREEKRETILSSQSARGAVTSPVTDSERVTGHGSSGHEFSGHAVTGDRLGLAADDVVDLLQRRCGRRVVLSFDSQQLAAFQRLLTDLVVCGQVDRRRLEVFAEWVAEGGMAWKRVRPDLRYLCGVGVLARHIAEAVEWDDGGRGPIRRASAAGAAPAAGDEDARVERDGSAEWAGAVDVTEQRLREERTARKSASAAREEVVHVG